jgi:hypothetical protein
MADPHDGDFLEGWPYDDTDAVVSPPARRRRLPAWATTLAWLGIGLLAGAVGVTLLHSSSSADAANRPAAVTNQPPDRFGGGVGGGFGGGRLDGEQHVVGTLTAVNGASLTVATGTGRSTYTIDASTELVKDGQPVSSLSAMSVGDTVVVHVYPANGTDRVERVIDGPPPTSTTTT